MPSEPMQRWVTSSPLSPLFFIVFAIFFYLLAKLVLPLTEGYHTFHKSKHVKNRKQRKNFNSIPDGYFLNKDNLYIHHRAWTPVMDPMDVKYCIVLVHGVGEHSGRYEKMANILVNELGVAIVSLDHQGHGKSEGDRLFVVSFNDYVEDVMEVSKQAKERYPNAQLILLGHSLGGLIAIRCLEKYPNLFVSAILSAPALSVNASKIERTLAPYFSQFLPKLTMNSVNVECLTHDHCIVDLYCNDPLVTTRGVSARLGAEILSTIDEALAFASELTLPYLLIRGANDTVALRPGIADFYSQTKSLDKSFVEFPSLYHEIFNEPDSPALKSVIDFIKSRFLI